MLKTLGRLIVGYAKIVIFNIQELYLFTLSALQWKCQYEKLSSLEQEILPTRLEVLDF